MTPWALQNGGFGTPQLKAHGVPVLSPKRQGPVRYDQRCPMLIDGAYLPPDTAT